MNDGWETRDISSEQTARLLPIDGLWTISSSHQLHFSRIYRKFVDCYLPKCNRNVLRFMFNSDRSKRQKDKKKLDCRISIGKKEKWNKREAALHALRLIMTPCVWYIGDESFSGTAPPTLHLRTNREHSVVSSSLCGNKVLFICERNFPVSFRRESLEFCGIRCFQFVCVLFGSVSSVSGTRTVYIDRGQWKDADFWWDQRWKALAETVSPM